MNIIQVQSLPLKDVIIGFAKSFGTTYSESCGDFRIDLPENWGEGYIRGINFDGGLGLLQYFCKFKADLEIQFVIDDIHPLKYLFCLEGVLSHQFEKDHTIHALKKFQNVIVASSRNNGHIIRFDAGISTEIYSLEIDRKKFKSKMACEISKAKPLLKKMFDDDLAIHQFYYKGLYSLSLALIFQEITDFKNDGFINKLFLEGKAYQILSNQLIQYDDDEKHETNRDILRKSEVKSILEAVAMIENNLDTLGSIRTIAHKVGLNGNKIQDGFKSLYGMTVNSYIQKCRLETARNLLLNTDFSIQEIMQKVGWNSKSYFSKIFRETYHTSPSEFRLNSNIN